MNKDIAAYCLRHHWVLGVNDPDLIGWLTVVAYLAAAVLCYTIGRSVPKISARGIQSEYWFWLSLALVLVALGFNKQLDLQTPFLGLSKHLAIAEGWYRKRYVVQWAFIACVAMVSGSVLVWIHWKLRHRWRDYWLVYTGIILILGFVLFQALPIHGVYLLPQQNVKAVLGKKHIMELVGIGCIGIAGLISLRRARLSNL